MGSGLPPNTITALAEMLTPPDEDSDSDLDQVRLVPSHHKLFYFHDVAK